MAITPYLLYEDVGGALKFLSKAFGFRKCGRTMSGPGGKINHAAMKLGDDFIMMGCPGSKYKSPKRLGQATQNLYVTVATARRIRKAISGTLLRRSRSAHLRNALLDDRADEFASRRMNRSMCLQ